VLQSLHQPHSDARAARDEKLSFSNQSGSELVVTEREQRLVLCRITEHRDFTVSRMFTPLAWLIHNTSEGMMWKPPGAGQLPSGQPTPGRG